MLQRLLTAVLSLPVLALAGGAASADQPRPWNLGFQAPASPIMERVTSFHHLLLWVISFISVFVLGLLLFACWRFRASVKGEPTRRSHNTLLEVVWTGVPVLILVIIAVPSFKLLYYEDVLPETEMTVKAIGHQWYWSYQYPEQGNFEMISNMVADEDLQPGQPRLLQTDNEIVVPVQTSVRLQVTATDVLHSWAMPSFGIKVDAIPGRLNEGWFKVAEPGIYYGQCSELCGINHAYMPITIRAVAKDEFEQWLEKAKVEFAAADSSPAQLAAAPAVPAR